MKKEKATYCKKREGTAKPQYVGRAFGAGRKRKGGYRDQTFRTGEGTYRVADSLKCETPVEQVEIKKGRSSKKNWS